MAVGSIYLIRLGQVIVDSLKIPGSPQTYYVMIYIKQTVYYILVSFFMVIIPTGHSRKISNIGIYINDIPRYEKSYVNECIKTTESETIVKTFRTHYTWNKF